MIEGHFTPFWCIGIGTGVGKSRIKDVLSHLSQAVSEKRASELLPSMVAPKIFFSGLPTDNFFEINV